MSAAHLSTSTLRTCRAGQSASYPVSEHGETLPTEHILSSHTSYLSVPDYKTVVIIPSGKLLPFEEVYHF